MKKKDLIEDERAIQLIKDKQYKELWKYVKDLGSYYVQDIEERYILFRSAVKNFDYCTKKNFKKYYIGYLKYNRLNINESFILTTDRRIIKELKYEFISPDLERTVKYNTVASELKKFVHYLEKE